ncbi:hypothetical protein IAT38_003746 [Cryptococcus sp. DSM 104549]
MSYADFPTPPTIPVEPFRLSISDQDVDDLKQYIRWSRISKETYENLNAEEHTYGVTREWLAGMKDAWAGFDWRKQESRINKQPQFIAKLKNTDGREYDIHFAALFSKKADAVPIILTHGWPGCYLEFLPIMELVSGRYAPEDLPYHLIIPTLPGWLFSTQAPKDAEFYNPDIAYLFDQLMQGLGFGGGYVAQGGDIGSQVTAELGVLDACKMIHLNHKNISTPPPKIRQAHNIPDETPASFLQLLQKYAYGLEHGTRPSTVGLAIGSSPMALLAWIGEKYLAWSDADLSEETILTFASLYWYTDCFASSLYHYRYHYGIKRGGKSVDTEYYPTPTGYSYFPKEIVPTPVAWVEERVNLVWSREHKSGGHFAALELPEVLWKDIDDFVQENWEKYR